MFARVNEFTGTSDQLDADLAQAQTISRRVDTTPGSLGMYYLIDRQAGKALAITLWESEAALKASESRAAEIREESSRAAGTRIMGVGRYEVAVNTARVPVVTK